MASNKKMQNIENYLKSSDPILKQIINTVGTCTLKPNKKYFESLAWIVVSQQLSKNAADSIYHKLELETGGINPINILNTKIEIFRKAGLSKGKSEYLMELASVFSNGGIKNLNFESMTDEDIINKLTLVKGIGRWSAQMFLIFSLNRLDILPLEDAGFLRAFKKNYTFIEKVDKEYIQTWAERWRPYRSIAVWYLWQSIKNLNKEIFR